MLVELQTSCSDPEVEECACHITKHLISALCDDDSCEVSLSFLILSFEVTGNEIFMTGLVGSTRAQH